jgi:hypothetical protein
VGSYPLVSYIGGVAAGSGTNIFATMSPEVIFVITFAYCIGAIAMAGIIGILKSSKSWKRFCACLQWYYRKRKKDPPQKTFALNATLK